MMLLTLLESSSMAFSMLRRWLPNRVRCLLWWGCLMQCLVFGLRGGLFGRCVPCV